MFHQPFKDENKLVGVARADFRFVKQIKLLGGFVQRRRSFQQLATENLGVALTLFREHLFAVDFTGRVVTERSVAGNIEHARYAPKLIAHGFGKAQGCLLSRIGLTGRQFFRLNDRLLGGSGDLVCLGAHSLRVLNKFLLL